MTTDNRTNEPTEAQIQIFDQIDMPEYNPSANSGRGDWGLRNVSDGTVMTHPTDIVRCVEHGAMNSVSPNRAIWRCLMCGRSAYRDIAGDAALEAAQGAAPQAESVHRHEGWMIRETGTGGYYCSSCGEPVTDPRAPVLPSSTVDEAVLADVIEAEIEGLRHETRLYPDIYKAQVARAVAEWLKGQGRGSEM